MHFTKPLVLNSVIFHKFISAYLPSLTYEQKTDPSISPYFEDLEQFRGRLPKALFTCGTEDPLLDDSLVMAAKWGMSGGDQVLKIYPGACHGFIGFVGVLDEAGEALEDTKTFIREVLLEKS